MNEDGDCDFMICFWKGKISNNQTFKEQSYDLWHKKELKALIKKIEYTYDFNKLTK